MNVQELTARIQHAAAVLSDAVAAETQIAKLSSDLQAAQEALASQDAEHQAQIDALTAMLPPVETAA
jgi:hypothetical protein